MDRAAFNTQNHSSVKNGTSLESSKLLEFQGSKQSILRIRFHAEVLIFVLRRPLFADRRKCLKISVCPGLETVSNNGNMPYPMATLSQIGRRSFLLTPSNPSTYRHNRPPLMVLDWNLADFWPSCNRVAELLIRHILSKTISCFFYGRLSGRFVRSKSVTFNKFSFRYISLVFSLVLSLSSWNYEKLARYKSRNQKGFERVYQRKRYKKQRKKHRFENDSKLTEKRERIKNSNYTSQRENCWRKGKRSW